MAIDSADKRRTAYGWGLLQGFLAESPSGTIAAAERLGIYALYSGIGAATPLDISGKTRIVAGHEYRIALGHEYRVVETR